MSENQAGFRQQHSTLDHVFVLKALVDMFVSQKKKLYCAFVDYRKAFDSVWRAGLWYKLAKQMVNGKVLKVIVSMYNQIKSCIFVNSSKSDFFWKFPRCQTGRKFISIIIFTVSQ